MNWSYGVLEIRNTSGPETFPVQFIDFDTGPESFEDSPSAFRKLGSQQWELVSSIHMTDEQVASEKVTRHFFKRPGGKG